MRFDLVDLRLVLNVADAGNITHGAARSGLALASPASACAISSASWLRPCSSASAAAWSRLPPVSRWYATRGR
jgi:hypothetical protein